MVNKKTIVAGLLMLAVLPMAQADTGCNLRPPQALLLPHAYPGQTARPGTENTLVESAMLANGVRIEIRRSACVDGVSSQLVLLVPGKLASDQAAIDKLRTTIGQLKWDSERAWAPSLLTFLQRAPSLPVRQGVRAVCNDDSVAEPGQCSWESNGGFELRIELGAKTTRIILTATISA
jgi:hypothetical protein